MLTFSATDAKQSFGAALEAAQRAPVMIRKQNRDVAVILSVQEYQKLRGLRIEALHRLCEDMSAKAAARGLTTKILAELMRDEGLGTELGLDETEEEA